MVALGFVHDTSCLPSLKPNYVLTSEFGTRTNVVEYIEDKTVHQAPDFPFNNTLMDVVGYGDGMVMAAGGTINNGWATNKARKIMA